MGVRASLSALLTSSALSGNGRASFTAALAAESLAGPIRVSQSSLLVANPLHGNSRVSGSYVLAVVQYGSNAFFLNTLDSNSAIYGVDSYDVTLTVPVTPESNPYKPLVPEMLSDKVGVDGYAYLQENQETLRDQHNLSQAGDTTFPYQLTVASHSIQHYKLGSVGRFYHPDYGVLQARYVQFKGMVQVDTPHCPVGLLRSATSLDWVVTNDYDKSSPDLVVGISAPWILATDSHYGWVIVDGPILQQVSNDSPTFAIGESFAWSGSGRLSTTASGKVVGRRVAKATTPKLLAGSMWVRAESFSEAQINQIITQSTQALLAELQALEHQLSLLPSASVLAALQRTVSQLRVTLTNEASARIAADLRLNERIAGLSFVTTAQLNAALTLVRNALESELTILTSNLAFINTNLNTQTVRIDNLYGITNDLQSQIDAILSVVTGLLTPVKSRFPVVDGSVPPNLVYLDDGSLVYVEVS